MIRFPTYSFAFIFVAAGIGVLTGNDKLGWTLAGIGSLAGYVVWVRARLTAIRNGQAFHVGSALNVFLCTVFAVGFGIAGFSSPYGLIGFFSKGDEHPENFWLVVLVAAAGVIWLHWDTARAAHALRLLPTAGEVGREIFEIATADEIGLASGLVAGAEVGRDIKSRLHTNELRTTSVDARPVALPSTIPAAIPTTESPMRRSKKSPAGGPRRRARTAPRTKR